MKWKQNRADSKSITSELMRQGKVLKMSSIPIGLQGVYFKDFVIKFDNRVYQCGPGDGRNAVVETEFKFRYDLLPIPIGKYLM